MKIFTHPLPKYGLALVYYKNNLTNSREITHDMLIEELRNGLRHFRLNCLSDASLSENLTFEYLGLEDYKKDSNLIQSAGLSNAGKYLAPNIIADEKTVKHTYNGLVNLITKLENNTSLDKAEALTMSIAPVSGKINNGKTSQSNPSASILEVACSAIASTTPIKPCFSFEGNNLAIIPDLSLENLVSFIGIFDKILIKEIEPLLKAKSKDGKYRRPLIFRGNYPDAPFNPIFGSLGIIASLGKWSKEAENYDEANEILMALDSLKKVPIYTFGYGTADTIYYNHYLIELAKENKLRNIVRGFERSSLFTEERKTFDNPKYKQFFLFTSRFLELFNEPSFRDFLSFRAYYEPELIHLFNIYFNKIMAIPKEIVSSARELGRWLNYVAYIAAKQGEGENSTPDQIKKAKAKFLVEIESSAFSARDGEGEALVSRIVTRAGRLSGMDAPPEAKVFMEATMTGEITVEQAQHIITAFSRLRNKFEKSEEPIKEEVPTLELDNT